MRAHLEAAVKAGMLLKQAEIDNPEEIPAGLDRLWATFLEISYTERTYMEGMPLPISSMALKAWSELRGIAFEPWEITIIRRLDSSWIKAKMTKREGV